LKVIAVPVLATILHTAPLTWQHAPLESIFESPMLHTRSTICVACISSCLRRVF